MLSSMCMGGSFKLNEWKFKEAYMKYKCRGEHMSAKEREQEINLQNFKI